MRRAAVVADPKKGRELATGEGFVNGDQSERDRRWWPVSRSGAGKREPLQDGAKIKFEAKRRGINANLVDNDCAELCDSEVWAGRLCECLPFQPGLNDLQV